MAKSESKRLIRNVVASIVLIVAIYIGYMQLSRFMNPPLEIDDTPLQIESIESILEISTVSYTGEVVVDSVEFYNGDFDWTNLNDWWNVKDRLDHPDVKRRLTLIVKGEAKFGFDLKKDSLDITPMGDTIYVKIPKAKLLGVEISPSKTEVFQEQGEWSDSERKQLEYKAIDKIKTSALLLDLETEAQESAVKLFNKLIIPNKTILVEVY